MDLFLDPPWACLDIRHKRLRLVPPCGLQQLGRPVWRIHHTTPDGPPWLADSGLRRWYTYLVYPQQTHPSNNTLANKIFTTIQANTQETLFDLSSCKKFLLALIFAFPILA
jgi:hypothetical protein